MPPVPALSAKANISASSAAMVANVAACAGTGWLTLRSTEKSCSWPVMPARFRAQAWIESEVSVWEFSTG